MWRAGFESDFESDNGEKGIESDVERTQRRY